MCSVAYGDEVNVMLEKMKHRGPDETRVSGKLGMSRLSIIDLKSEGLCLYEEDGVKLAFNGEIYNYKELKSELGGEFRTSSDTEVLLRAYRQWGTSCLERFNGMYAFIIEDGDTIFFARDVAGEKPLYYRESPFGLASEAKALNYDCKEVPPAHMGTYKDGKIVLKRYWRPKKRHIDILYAEKELEDLLEDSIRLRTQADVPYGLYKSGGVDSTLISTFHDFRHKYTYHDEDFKEEFLRDFPDILWHLDYPVKSFSAFALWKLAQEAKNDGVRVVLSGEGADELFGGYVRYVPNSLAREAQTRFPSYKDMFPYDKDVNEQGWEEFNGNMQELLRMGDRMASAHGIENRCPFLDKRIIEFAFNLPPEAKIQGFDTKLILRRILQRRMPKYQTEEKHGLYCSVNKWLNVKDKLDKEKYLSYQQKLWNSQR